MDIQSDKQGNIYVGEPGVSVIRKITPNGDVTHFAGTTNTTYEQLILK